MDLCRIKYRKRKRHKVTVELYVFTGYLLDYRVSCGHWTLFLVKALWACKQGSRCGMF